MDHCHHCQILDSSELNLFMKCNLVDGILVSFEVLELNFLLILMLKALEHKFLKKL